MSEAVLDALVKLFALIGDIHDETVITSREKDLVRTFLSRHLNQELIDKYMKRFEDYLSLYNSESIRRGSLEDRKRISLNSMRILGICESINEELEQKQKLYILVQLIEFISLGAEISETELDFLATIAGSFHIPGYEYENIRAFVMKSISDVPDKNRILVIDNGDSRHSEKFRHIPRENMPGMISFLSIISTGSCILRFQGKENLYLNGQVIRNDQPYFFDHGSSIRGPGLKRVYYSEVVGRLSDSVSESRISFDADDVSFRFRNSEKGIHNLHFHEVSGHLVGIMGGSGVGKSTTLSILNGSLKPHGGKVLINGYDLYEEKDRDKLAGVIGYVPQDDLLIEELTVFENLWFNARMCLSNLHDTEIANMVGKSLADFDLTDIKDLKVGSPLNKVISGGQRKRLNIALELIREPAILFVDEPTSGLSSTDAEIVMNLLKEQSYKGKIVIVNIHQPGSDIYKMFDRILIIDRGGYQVYYGNPGEAIVYFRTMTNHANPEEDQCAGCGNIDTDQILQVIEAKVIDEQGKPTRIRKVSPAEWAARFREYSAPGKPAEERTKKSIPGNRYSIPGLLKQIQIFFHRDLLSKAADRQYLAISLLGPPTLALILSWFTRSPEGSLYSFSENENIPAYMFMSVITSLFFGLMVSSQEIIRDRKILRRESFLNLSWFSYLSGKVLLMFIISAIQTISFVVIGNLILDIRGMTLSYWLVLFATSCFANMLGLIISSAFSSVITIYIIIPFIVIPQLLFSGVLVKFDKLHLSRYSTREYVPLIGDIMVARWSFEGLAVKQFSDNEYERNFFDLNIEESESHYYALYLVPQLRKDLVFWSNFRDSVLYKEAVKRRTLRIAYYIGRLSGESGITDNGTVEKLNSGFPDIMVVAETEVLLDTLREHFMSRRKDASNRKDKVSASLIKNMGRQELTELRENHENKKLAFTVLNMELDNMIYETEDRLIRKFKPGYMKPSSRYGRAHLYAPVKYIGRREFGTLGFNLGVISIVTLLLYALLCFNVPRKIADFAGGLKFSRQEN